MPRQKGKGENLITSTLEFLSNGACEANHLFDLWTGDSRTRKSMGCEKTYQSKKARLRYLKEKKLIAVKKKEDKVIVELTKKGDRERKKRRKNKASKLPVNQVCLVTYDIPTTANKARDAFRFFLKKLGFKKINQSVWQTEFNVIDEVLGFVRKAKIGEWVCVFVAAKTG